ncbi:MAG: phosphoribosylglycinamide formyltransferase [Bacteroidetes bacterium]|nr:phosphoribosylglycinamide formyltransferase [Bacteroidota bacterium]
MKNIAVFASGEGTNAQQLINHFRSSDLARVALIVTNNPKAHVIERAKASHIPHLLIDKKTFSETTFLPGELKKYNIDLIALAGFLWLIPAYLNKVFHNKIVNIHPALLPKYGGKGMYGANVHKAVIAGNEKESGITIHYVNENYDEGEIILQVKCDVTQTDTPETLAAKIHKLEHEYYAKTIEKLLK